MKKNRENLENQQISEPEAVGDSQEMEIEMQKNQEMEKILAAMAEQEEEKNELLQRFFLMEEQVVEKERLDALERKELENKKGEM